MRIWTRSGKKQNYVPVGDKAQRECQWRHVCLRDTPQYEHHPWLRGSARCAHLQPRPLNTVHTFSGSLVIHLRTCTHRGSSDSSLRHSPHPHGHPRVCVVSSPWSSLSTFLLYLPPLLPFLNHMESMVNLHNSYNESVDASDDLLLLSTLNESWWADSTGMLHLSAKRHRSIIWWKTPHERRFWATI